MAKRCFQIAISNAERGPRVAGELEAAQRRARTGSFREREDLKSAAEHFRMEQCLEPTLVFWFFRQLRHFRNYSGYEVMLIRESGDAQTVRFSFPEPDGAALAKLSAMHLGNRQFYRDVGWGEKHW